MRRIADLNKQGKILYLDGLRGIAASSVVVVHFILAFYGALYYLAPNQVHTMDGKELEIGRSLLSMLYSANLAVPILFMLSAYVLSYRFFRDKDSSIVVASAFRRYIRLAIPNLASALLGYLFLRNSLYYSAEASKLTLSTSWLGAFYQFEPNLFLAVKQGLWDGFFAYIPEVTYKVSYNPTMWTMTYELAGSFLVFTFLTLFGVSAKRYIVYIAMMFILGKSHYAAFIFGLIISDVHNSEYGRNICQYLERRNWLSWGMIGAGFMIGDYFPDGRNYWSTIMDSSVLEYIGFDLWVFYHTLGAAFVLVGILVNKQIQCMLTKPIIQFLGRIAYSMYLTHVIIICSIGSYAFLYFYYAGFSYGASVFLGTIVCMVFIVFVAYLMTKYVDDPAIKIARIIQKKYLS